MHSESIDTIHLLLAILKANDCQASNIMSEMNVTYASLAQIAHTNKEQKNREDNENKNTDEEAVVEYVTPEEDSPAASSTPRNTSSDTQTPLLDNFGTDLTKAAQENLLDPVVGRENEIERVAQILCRRKKNNPILIGEPGCGKSAIVEGLAQLIVKHRISRSLWDKRIVMLDMACVVAGTKYRGQFEERIRSISNELKNNPNVIVFIDEIHTIVGAGNAEGRTCTWRVPVHRCHHNRRVQEDHREGRCSGEALPEGAGESFKPRRNASDTEKPQGTLRRLPPCDLHGRGSGGLCETHGPVHERALLPRQSH